MPANESPAMTQDNQTVEVHSQEASRIQSIDIFRGMNVLAMIFVDNLGFVTGLPWWTYHMPREANGMTYVDMVFPAFLFLMGMSIPISIRSRRAKGQSRSGIWTHAVVRSLSLVGLGLFVSNAPQVDAQRTGISFPWWAALGFIAIALVWMEFPESDKHRTTSGASKFVGLAMLAGLIVIFRRVTPEGKVAWLDFPDWEILGLLGWAYLSVSTIYLSL
ncbi:MAG TPA: DUF5009 domain-containing protein [Candidatus Acidoferrum sp.]|nr:DUF5009 domain-containing protein [Candidatus Acidoferrum sp.]